MPEKFSHDNCDDKDDELFVDLFDILDVSKPTSNLDTILHKSSKTESSWNE